MILTSACGRTWAADAWDDITRLWSGFWSLDGPSPLPWNPWALMVHYLQKVSVREMIRNCLNILPNKSSLVRIRLALFCLPVHFAGELATRPFALLQILWFRWIFPDILSQTITWNLIDTLSWSDSWWSCKKQVLLVQKTRKTSVHLHQVFQSFP